MSSVLTLLVLLSALSPARAADFTRDGIDDLAIGVPQQSSATVAYVGGVEVIRGSSTGLTSNRDLFFHQDTTAVAGVADERDYFGYALAAGDIDGDARDDLIVGAPTDTVGSLHCGFIWRVELATSTSTRVTTSQVFSQATSGVTGTAESGDDFGFALAVGDFDADGYDDVIVGIPGESIGSATSAGAIEYLRGSSSGLTTSGQIEYDQDVADVAGGAESGDQFGYALAAGDFDGSGYDDVAIGIPSEDWGGTDEGAVQIMYGMPGGPGVVSPDDELWTAGEGTAAGTLGDDNRCGWALAVGDLDGDGYDNLAVGCPHDDSPGASQAGSVLVLYGSSGGLDDSELWSQATAGVLGAAESGDAFGSVLTSGDYDGDTYADLAIGAPEEDWASTYNDDGALHVLFGSASGLTEADDLLFGQDTSGVLGSAYTDEHWPTALTSGDYNDDGLDDLAIGSGYDDESGLHLGGAVNVLYGSSTGPTTVGDALFTQDSTGIDDVAEAYDMFGFSLR